MGVSPDDQAFAAEAMVLGLQADAPIGFAVHDEELRFEVVSDALAAMNGCPPAEHIGKRVIEILPEELGRPVEALLAGVRDTGQPRHGVEIEGTTLAYPGESRCWVASFYPLKLPAGRRVGVVVVDVTERHRTQQALRESERVLSGAQRMAGLGWWTWIAQPETVVYAPELLSMMGRDPARGGVPQSRDQLVFAEPDEMESVRRDALHSLEHETPFARRIRARHADGDLRLLNARASIIYEQGVPIGLQGFVQDITELARAEDCERLVAELGQQALAGVELPELMERAIASVMDQAGVDGAAVLELAEGGDELLVRASRSTFADPAEAARVAITPGSVPDHVLTTGQAVVIDDSETDGRFARNPAETAAGARSIAAVVIAGRGRPFGVLGTMSREPACFDRNDLAFLQAIANVLADAVERQLADSEIAELSAARGRLVAQALDAEERARRRMSDTLHDGALQDLLAAGHDLHALESQDGAVRDVQARLSDIIRRLREVMSSMHPTVLQFGGLEAALRAVAEQQGRVGGFEPRVSVDEDALGVRDELLLSVARELLENAARHASASVVAVEVRRDGDEIVIEVSDNGAGFAADRPERALAEGGIGLASCRERVEALGGAFAVRATPGAGTRVRATAPVLSNPDR